MPRAATRIPERLYRALVKLDDGTRSVADITRDLGELAVMIDVPRPSYERVRLLVHEARAVRRGPTTGEVLLDIAFKARPPSDFLDHLVDDLPRRDNRS